MHTRVSTARSHTPRACFVYQSHGKAVRGRGGARIPRFQKQRFCIKVQGRLVTYTGPRGAWGAGRVAVILSGKCGDDAHAPVHCSGGAAVSDKFETVSKSSPSFKTPCRAQGPPPRAPRRPARVSAHCHGCLGGGALDNQNRVNFQSTFRKSIIRLERYIC